MSRATRPFHTKPWIVRWAVSMLFLSLAAPVLATPQQGAPGSQRVTILHWWTSPSESAALEALVALFRSEYPDVSVSGIPAAGSGNMRSLFPVLKMQRAQKQPVDAFQMFAGCAGQVFYDAGLLSPIDDLWADENLEAVIPPVIRDLSRFEGHYYSVPVNVHRTNVIWYNKPLLEKYGIDANRLTTWESFFAAAEALRAAGVRRPIQLGVDWTAKAVFEDIMASQGIGVYEDWINGKVTAADDPRLIKGWMTFEKYLSYVNPDRGTLTWDAAVRRVMSGEGAFCTMGDWANGEFRLAGLRYGKDYGTIVVPGTRGMFGLGVDTFLQPSGLPNSTGSYRWLKTAASRDGQDAFNSLKGSISPRTDTDVSRYDSYQRTAIADLKSARYLYPTLGSAMSEASNNRLLQILARFMTDLDVGRAAADVASEAKQAAGRDRRIWRLR
jgi:glucose/mannose transport system substrate-binding protein